jgi:hypothetical protein
MVVVLDVPWGGGCTSTDSVLAGLSSVAVGVAIGATVGVAAGLGVGVDEEAAACSADGEGPCDSWVVGGRAAGDGLSAELDMPLELSFSSGLP